MRNAIFLIMLALFVCSCGTARRGHPLTGIGTPEDERLLRGQRAFQQYCGQCHPGGQAGVGPAINNKPLPPFMIRMQVRTGMGAMPSFSEEKLSGETLDDIIAYLKELRRRPCCRDGEMEPEEEERKGS